MADRPSCTDQLQQTESLASKSVFGVRGSGQGGSDCDALGRIECYGVYYIEKWKDN